MPLVLSLALLAACSAEATEEAAAAPLSVQAETTSRVTQSSKSSPAASTTMRVSTPSP